MLIPGNNRLSKPQSCLEAASHFLLAENAASAVFAKQREAIEANWEAAYDEAKLSTVDRKLFWNRLFLNSFAFEK